MLLFLFDPNEKSLSQVRQASISCYLVLTYRYSCFPYDFLSCK